MNYQVPKALYKKIVSVKIFGLFIFLLAFISSCKIYTALSFENKTNETIYLEYIQVNKDTLRQAIEKKEDLNLMFGQRWTDENIKSVVEKIDRIIIYNSSDTLVNLSNKEKLFTFFKMNKSPIFKDKISIQIK